MTITTDTCLDKFLGHSKEKLYFRENYFKLKVEIGQEIDRNLGSLKGLKLKGIIKSQDDFLFTFMSKLDEYQTFVDQTFRHLCSDNSTLQKTMGKIKQEALS